MTHPINMFPTASRLFNAFLTPSAVPRYLHVNYLIILSEARTLRNRLVTSLYGTVYKYELRGQHVSDEATAKEDSLYDRLIIVATSLKTRFARG